MTKEIKKNSGKLRTSRIDPAQIIKEALRNYTVFRRHAALHGDHTIEHTYTVYTEEGEPKEKITISFSLWDLFRGIKKVSPRKREALWYGVILDKKQDEVGEIMGCQSVTSGQYANAAAAELAKEHLEETIEIL